MPTKNILHTTSHQVTATLTREFVTLCEVVWRVFLGIRFFLLHFVWRDSTSPLKGICYLVRGCVREAVTWCEVVWRVFLVGIRLFLLHFVWRDSTSPLKRICYLVRGCVRVAVTWCEVVWRMFLVGIRFFLHSPCTSSGMDGACAVRQHISYQGKSLLGARFCGGCSWWAYDSSFT